MALWNPLRRLFGNDGLARGAAGQDAPLPPADAAAPARARGPLAPAAPGAPAAGAPAVEPAADALPALAQRYGALLLGGGLPLPEPPSADEQAALGRLQQLVARGLDAAAVPRLPAVLPKLMAMSRRDDVSPRELSDLLARDPALVGEVVRLANSPRYRTQRPIEDLTGALMLLGQVGLSQLVMRAAVRPLFQRAQGRLGQVAAGGLWDLSERCGHACASRRAGQADAFAAYLAGTAVPVGLIVALRVLDLGTLPAAPGTETFHAALWGAALRLSSQAAAQWDFPGEVVHALAVLAGPAMGRDEVAAHPTPAALRQGLAAALRHALGDAADDLPAAPAEAGLVADLRRTFDHEAQT